MDSKITSFEGYEKRTYTVTEIQDILGVSQPTIYNLIKQNLFHCVKIGRAIRVSKKSFDEWLDYGSQSGGTNGK